MSDKAYEIINSFLSGNKLEAKRAFEEMLDDKKDEVIEKRTMEFSSSLNRKDEE